MWGGGEGSKVKGGRIIILLTTLICLHSSHQWHSKPGSAVCRLLDVRYNEFRVGVCVSYPAP